MITSTVDADMFRNLRSEALCGVPSGVWYPGRVRSGRVRDTGVLWDYRLSGFHSSERGGIAPRGVRFVSGGDGFVWR
eukprot:7570680-Pyramimonas_sp.AAC.1